MNNVVIIKSNGGLGFPAPLEDGISGMITTGVEVSEGVQHGECYELRSVADAEALGINADYDTNNNVLVYQRIKRFFQFAGGQSLFFMMAAQSVSLSDLADDEAAIGVVRLATLAQGKIRQMAVCINPTSGYSPSPVDGLTGDVVTAIGYLEDSYDVLYNQGMPCHFILEGRGFNGSATDAGDLRDQEKAHVSVVIGQDKAVGNLGEYEAAHADVSTPLAFLAYGRVNESCAWPKKFRLDDQNNYQAPAISSGALIDDISAVDQNTLNEKGYILPRRFANFPGVYYNDCHTCDAITSDFAYIPENRVIDKVVRNTRQILIPELNSPLAVDPANGKLRPEVCKSFEALCFKASEQMVKDTEVSGLQFYVDPSQNVLSTNTLNVKATIISTATARNITVNIGFSNPFNA